MSGKIITMDITGCKKKSKGGNKYAHVKIDYGSKILFVTFMKKKNEAIEDGIQCVKTLTKLYKMPKYIRMDQSGENKKMKKHDSTNVSRYSF